jgi:hypothetical protein
LILATLWLGLLLGVSFLATPVKFLAPSLTLPVALNVGRQTFAVFNRVEWVLIALLAVLLIAGTRTSAAVAGFIVAAAVTSAQTFWMLPVLDARVSIIMAGGQLPPSSLHNIYLVAEVIKLLALLVLSMSMARQLAAGGRSHMQDVAAEAASHTSSSPAETLAASAPAAHLADRALNSIDRNPPCA